MASICNGSLKLKSGNESNSLRMATSNGFALSNSMVWEYGYVELAERIYVEEELQKFVQKLRGGKLLFNNARLTKPLCSSLEDDESHTKLRVIFGEVC